MAEPHKITPFLWFDNQAEEAANFYVSLFPDDPAKARRVTAAMLKMSKIDVAALEAAHRG